MTPNWADRKQYCRQEYRPSCGSNSLRGSSKGTKTCCGFADTGHGPQRIFHLHPPIPPRWPHVFYPRHDRPKPGVSPYYQLSDQRRSRANRGSSAAGNLRPETFLTYLLQLDNWTPNQSTHVHGCCLPKRVASGCLCCPACHVIALLPVPNAPH
jgi:hypothetical protein